MVPHPSLSSLCKQTDSLCLLLRAFNNFKLDCQVVSLVGAQKASLHPDDMLLLSNFVMSSESFRQVESSCLIIWLQQCNITKNSMEKSLSYASH